MSRQNGTANSQSFTFTYSGGNHRNGYLYDANGNVTKENAEGLLATYNILNLPAAIQDSGSGITLANYKYYADGIKRSAVDGSGDGVLYDGSFRYTISGNNSYSVESVAYDGGRFLACESSLSPEFPEPIPDEGGEEIGEEPIGEEIGGGEVVADEPGYTSVAYITDHLGSVRVVVGADGTVIKHNEFLPYGELFNNNDPYLTNNDYLYGGKELQKKFGINLYDSQARFQANTGMFLSLDPLAEKFYGISPYSYCAGNPVNLVDPSGKKVYLKANASEEFKKKFSEAVVFMNNHNTSYNLAKLEESDNIFYISETSGSTVYDPKTKTLYWNPTKIGYDNETDIYRSPVTSLAHELGHAKKHDEAITNDKESEYYEYIKRVDPQYDTVEEKRVITTTEQVAARNHGEISQQQVTRRKHTNHYRSRKDIPKILSMEGKTIEEIVDFVKAHNSSVVIVYR